MEIPTRLFNTALMLAPRYVDAIIAAKFSGVLPPVQTRELSVFLKTDCGVAIIDVFGGLQNRGDDFWGETTSYSDIREQFREALASPSVDSVLLMIDSPGGEVAGLFDLAEEIYQARGTKPIVAVASGSAFSAAYMIASAADEIYLSSTANVGSIGVIAIHVDQSGYDKEMGIKFTPVFAGDHKNDFNPHEPLKAEAEALLKEHIDKLYLMLTAIVARNRGMSQADVIATQAGIYMGADAVSVGLADGVLPVQDVFEKMLSSKGEIGMNLNEVKDIINQALAESMADVKRVLESIESRFHASEAAQPPEASEADVTVNLAGDIVDLCEVAGMPELSGAMIRDGLTIEAVKAAILDARAKASAEKAIVSTVGPLTTGEVNPLLVDAKKRVEALQK